MRALVPLAALVVLSGCELLSENGLPQLPTVTYKGASLAKSPSQGQLSAYYCPEVVPTLGGGGSLGCALAFGRAPDESNLEMAFQMDYGVDNPNPIPLPITQMLTAVTLFPSATQQKLGAACVVFCDERDASCTGKAGSGDCQSTQDDIKTLEDFSHAAGELVIAKGLQAAAGQPLTFEMPHALPQGESDLSALFGFVPSSMLQTLEQLAEQSVSQLASGEELTFDIPFALEGTVWFDTGSLGRTAVSFGPVAGSWRVPVQALANEAIDAAGSR